MRGGLRQHGLHIVGRDEMALRQQRMCLGRPQNADPGARAQALLKPLPVAGGGQQILQIVDERVSGMDVLHQRLQLQQVGCLHHGLQVLQQVAPCRASQQAVFGGAVGVAQAEAHQKAIQLRLGQGLGAALFQRVLRGNHEKGLRQCIGFAFGADLALFHGFKQRALCLGAGAVDFIGQQHLREHRPRVKNELLLIALVNRYARQVAGHQIRRELHAGKLQPQALRQRMRQRGFAHTRHVFDQQMAVGQQAHHGIRYRFGLAQNNLIELLQQGVQQLMGAFVGHAGRGRKRAMRRQRRRVF